MEPRPITDAGADHGRFTFTSAGDETGRLLFEGREVGRFAGVELVGFFAVDSVGWLVVTDCDCPFEETVFLHLLAADFSLLETCPLGGAYVAGIVEGMQRLGPAEFRILFPSSDHAQRITVASRKQGLLGTATRWLHVTAV